MHRKGGYTHLTGTRKTICFFLFLLFIVSTVFSGSGNCSQVTLAWDRNTEIDLAGYKIYYGTGSRVYNWFIDVGNVTSYTVTGLADGSTYFFAATAYDTSNIESTYSVEVSYNSCTYSISPTTAQLGQQGGTGTVQVSTQAGCRWTASSGASWFTITSGSQGTGSSTVAYSVSSNTSTNARTVASTIAGKVFTVTQAGSGATSYTITASAGSNGSISPSGAVSVTSGVSRAFTITPATGYKVSNVLVDGASVGAVTTYTFSNVTANHTISASFIIATSSVPAVKVLSPNGGESYYTGETKTVSWEAPAGVSSFWLSYSKNNGTTWITIAKTITGTTYRWNLPQLTKTYSKCKIRVIGYNVNGKEFGRDKSDRTFTMEIR